MKTVIKSFAIVLIACLMAGGLTGCRAVTVENYGEEIARDADEKPVTLADVQKAAAQMRDDGRLDAVKGLFPEFGIKKLSDLKGDALQGFAAKLREMGAKI